MSFRDRFIQQMERDRALIGFDEEVMQENYITYVAVYWGLNEEPDVNINIVFSLRSIVASDIFEMIYPSASLTFDILSSINLEVVT